MTQEEMKQKAEALRDALINGKTTVKDVVAWADEVIQNMPDAPYEILDISSSGDCSVPDMVSKLSSVPA